MAREVNKCSTLKDLNSLLRNFNFVLNTVGTSDESDQMRKVCGSDGLRNLVGLSADLETFKTVVSEIQARNNQVKRGYGLCCMSFSSRPNSQAAVVFPSHSAFPPSAFSFFREFYSFWNVCQDARMFFQVISLLELNIYHGDVNVQTLLTGNSINVILFGFLLRILKLFLLLWVKIKMPQISPAKYFKL